MERRPLIRMFFHAILFLNLCAIMISFGSRPPNSGLNLDSLLRFGIGFSGLLACLLYYKIWLKELIRYDNILLLPLLGLMAFSAFYSPSFVYTVRATMTVVFVIGIFFATVRILGAESVYRNFFFTVTVVSFLSLIAYYAFPSIGRGHSFENELPISGNRLSGITGHPNNIGFIAATGLLFAYFYSSFIKSKFNWIFVGAAGLLHVIVLALSDSRGSIAALAFALFVAFFSTRSVPRFVFLGIGAAVAAGVLMSIDLTPFIEKFSRTGSSDIGSGRAEIWAVAEELISERPWFGWGYSSSSLILPSYDILIGHAPPHTHNMVLQILFSIGCVGLAIFIVLIISKFFWAVRAGDKFKMALILFVLIHGLIEPSILQGVANTDTVIFALILALDYRRSRASRPIPAPETQSLNQKAIA